MKHHKSPCIDICKFSGPSKWCIGCGRTREEVQKCPKLKPYDIKKLKNILKKRMLLINNSQNKIFFPH